MSIDDRWDTFNLFTYSGVSNDATTLNRFSKRITPWGLPFYIPLQDLLCLGPEGSAENERTVPEKLSHVSGSGIAVAKRASGDVSMHHFDRRGVNNKKQDFAIKSAAK
jgi:chitinase